jgi:hypothetical protein
VFQSMASYRLDTFWLYFLVVNLMCTDLWMAGDDGYCFDWKLVGSVRYAFANNDADGVRCGLTRVYIE